MNTHKRRGAALLLALMVAPTASIASAQALSPRPTWSSAVRSTRPPELGRAVYDRVQRLRPASLADASRPVSAAETCQTHTTYGGLAVDLRKVSDWQTGASWEVILTNTSDTHVLTDVAVQFTLAGATDVQLWSMEADVKLPWVRLGLPSWNTELSPGEVHVFGFNVAPSAEPCRVRAGGLTGGEQVSPTTTPTPGDGGSTVDEPDAPPSPWGGEIAEGSHPSPLVPGVDLGSGSAAFAPPLLARGATLYNSLGEPVLLRGTSWFGAETRDYVVHGLWERNWQEMLQQVADEGFNVLRIPYSQDLLTPGRMPQSIHYGINADLEGLGALEILDKIVDMAGRLGLYVILDRHNNMAGVQTPLWYDGSRTATSKSNPYGEAAWIEGLELLAERYQDEAQVVGFDLHNEPYGAASWGTGDIATDWRMAAERAGERLLAINPDLLIIVEGVQQNVVGGAGPYWWGGNLSGVDTHPVELSIPGRVVYSPHDYGPGVYPQAWFWDATFPDNLVDLWDSYWAYIAEDGIAPVLIGEFGGRYVEPDAYPEGSLEWREAVWQQEIVQFQEDRGLSAIYWAFNPNSADTGGYLKDDWKTVVPAKRALLGTWMAR